MIMKYKGYVGHVTYDSEGKCFFGEVIGLNDGITFQGTTVEELEDALKDSVEVYLEWCVERGVEPEKTYSGKLRLRMKPSLHKKLSFFAVKKEISLNRLINETLTKSLCAMPEEVEEDEEADPVAESLVLAPSA